MSCQPRIEGDSYDFFDIIENYIKNGEVISNESVSSKELNNCISFSEQYTKGENSNIGKDICEQFLKLHTSIPNIKDNNKNYDNYKKDCNFLNFWLNYKLRESVLDGSVCVENFSLGIENQCSFILNFHFISEFIYHIVEEDFKKMKLLYTLYTHYSKLNSILSSKSPQTPQSLLEPSNNSYDYYNQARNMCYDKNNKFCQKLENFKSKYKELYKTLETKDEEFSKNFKRLPQNENIKIISTTTMVTSVGLIPLFGVLYKFTPLGQLFKPNKRKLTNEYSNNDEMRNILLMDQENKPIPSQQERYNIKYHSV
ncbi:Plasmodium vivax Vir protein, putative [Plasmodium vivax]|nr:Plasmodium vivax Vir protein, putative [Plasmodium vivax]